MLRINGTATKLGLKSKLAVKNISKQLKKRGFSDIYTGVSKNGTIGIIGTKADGFTKEAHIIKPDGQKILKEYTRIDSPDKTSGAFNRIIQTWESYKKGLVFSKRSTLFYDEHKLPNEISTMYADKECDGVEITRIFPFDKYAQHYMKKPQNN